MSREPKTDEIYFGRGCYWKPAKGANVRWISDKPKARAQENFERTKHAFKLSEKYRERKSGNGKK